MASATPAAPSAPHVERLAGVQKGLDVVTHAMRANIAATIQRNEDLEAALDKADQLEGHAKQFQRQARQSRLQECYNAYKLWLLAGGLVALIIVILAVAFSV